MTRNNSKRCLDFARHDKKGLIVGRSCETPFECCGVWHPQCDQETAVVIFASEQLLPGGRLALAPSAAPL